MAIASSSTGSSVSFTKPNVPLSHVDTAGMTGTDIEEATVALLSSTKAIPSSGCSSHRFRKNPSTFIAPLMVFVTLMASGLAVAFTISNSDQEVERNEATVLAGEVGKLFTTQLERALLPIFSLAQFVSEVDAFNELPDIIGPSLGADSLPYKDDTHRNVTGVCDDPALVNRFNRIAETIKRNADMDGILLNLQLAPEAVVCLIHPLNNTEDFPEGVFLDNTGAIGHDLLYDPARSFIAEKTIPADGLIIAGPLQLTQCRDVDCAPTVREAIFARLPIYSPTHTITVNGTAYKRWGFAVGLINWNELVVRSGVYDVFEEQGMEFQLTRKDRIAKDDIGFTEKIVVLAESPGYTTEGYRFVSTSLETTDNDWEITIAYTKDEQTAVFIGCIIASAIVAFCISSLVAIVLAQKQSHAQMAAKQSALLIANARASARVERELNDFIAHEVRNPLSAALSACNFVSTAVNEKEPLRTDESVQAVREDLHIVEASLHFINDLLRSMLDIHRADQKQLVLSVTPTDILQDILEPVVSMLYRRDEGYEVQIDCDPETLVVSADRLRLQQVVLNLGRNAAKFVEHGFVRFRASVDEDGHVCIFIEDSGPGIPLAKRKNLFCRFQESLDSLNQGTGVGLNLCKTLVDLMGGEIWLDESYDSGVKGMPGTRIVVNLKQAPEAIAEKRIVDVDDDVEQGRAALPLLVPPQEAIDLLPEKLSVLFVDDDRILRKLATRSLAKVRPGWTVREAASGETALHLLENESFDLIFMDQYMTSVEQALKGTETIRALRSKGVDIAVCGLSANDLESAFLSAGANAFILKPFPCKNEELKHELTRVLADHATGTTKTMNSSSDSLSTSSQDLNLVNAH